MTRVNPHTASPFSLPSPTTQATEFPDIAFPFPPPLPLGCLPQAHRPHRNEDKHIDTDDISIGNGDFSYRNCTFDQGGDGFSGSIEDTTTRDNGNTTTPGTLPSTTPPAASTATTTSSCDPGGDVSSVTTSLAFIPFPISTRPAAHEATSYLINLILLAFFSLSLSLFFSSLANYEGSIVFPQCSAIYESTSSVSEVGYPSFSAIIDT